MPQLRIQPTYSVVALANRVIDVATIGGSLFISQWLAGQDTNERSVLAIAAAVTVFVLVSEAMGAYRSQRTSTATQDLLGILASWTVTVLCLALIAFFTRHGIHFSRGSILGWILLTGAALGLMRMLIRILVEALFTAGWGTKRCAIAGLNELGIQLLENTQQNPAQGLKVLGFYDDRSKKRWMAVAQTRSQYLGKLDDLVAAAKGGEIDTVFVTLPMRAEARIRNLLEQLGDTTVNAYIVPDFFVFDLLHSRWSSIGGLPAVSVFETPLYGVDGWLKRTFDLIAATCAIVILTPVMLGCAMAVKLSSPGPVLFRQRRYGLDGQEIWIWKFRSMRVLEDSASLIQATRNDSRVTDVGRILRRTSLDELPQLFNVIEGSMSLVGPRPHATAHNERYRKLIRGYMLRHKVKPGITGLAQVEGYRGETETLDKMQKRVEYDHNYIQHWSMWLDLQILARTLWVVLKQENAY